MREGWKNGEVILPYRENQLRFKLGLSISLIFIKWIEQWLESHWVP